MRHKDLKLALGWRRTSRHLLVVGACLLINIAAFGPSTALAQAATSCTPIPITALPGDQRPVIAGGLDIALRLPPDVVIDTCVQVPSGIYTYGHVNVIHGGTLEFLDQAGGTKFYAKSIVIQSGGTVKAGTYDTPFGTSGGKLTIGLWGDDPTEQGTLTNPSDPGAYCKNSSGAPASCYPTKLTSRPYYCTGKDLTNPCNSTIPTASGDNALFQGYGREHRAFYLPFDKTTQGTRTFGDFGYKVLAVSYGGSLQLFGDKGVAAADYTNPAAKVSACPVPAEADQFTPAKWADLSGGGWGRLNANAAAGASSITLDRNVDWEEDDKVVLTTTDWQPGHSEILTIGATGSAQSLALKSGTATAYAHRGTIYSIERSDLSHDPGHMNTQADVRAAIGLLTRDITIRSMGASFDYDAQVPVPFPEASSCTLETSSGKPRVAVPSCYFGGHVIARQGFGKFQVQGVEFHQLGQGGRMGHYPVHFHLAKDTSYTNAFVRDSSIWDSMTRFIVLHGTHGVELSRNVGFMSIGHAYFLEDGSEINNLLCYNLGVSARAPYKGYFKAQIPASPTARVVPAILPGLETPVGLRGGDSQSPTMFWMMNAYNEFVGNMAVGSHGMGTCYWPLPSSVSGVSASSAMNWSSSTGPVPYRYANYNTAGGKSAPMSRFRGNTCSTAAYAIMTELMGVPVTYGEPVSTPYATMGAGAQPMLMNNFEASVGPDACSAMATDSTQAEAMAKTCATTILDHFTTSFNWAQVNFGSIWLRPWNYVYSNSDMTDQLYGGLAFVSGGSPEQANVHRLTISYNSLFVGSTDPESPKAGQLGPDLTDMTCTAGESCESAVDGTFYYLPSGLNPKRMMTIYDGPFFSDGSIFDVRTISCDPWATPHEGRPCGIYRASIQPWQPKIGTQHGEINIINAGIGWKQPNGFYYPPMFAFKNTAFVKGSERHNVLDQYKDYVFGLGTPVGGGVPIKGNVFAAVGGATPIDATTILNDLDGTLNGVRPQTGAPRTSGLSNNHFFDAPFGVPECNSFGTQTLPVDFVTTAVTQLSSLPSLRHPAAHTNAWPANRGGSHPAVAIYRQYKLPGEAESCSSPTTSKICNGTELGCQRGTFAMGAAVGTGFALTMRNGVYYIDTQQQSASCAHIEPPFKAASYAPGGTYGVYHLYANDETKVTYQIHVGEGFHPHDDFSWIRVLPHKTGGTNYHVNYRAAPAGITAPVVSNGVLTVVLDNSKISEDFTYQSSDPARCQPLDICKPDETTHTCTINGTITDPGMAATISDICEKWVTPANVQSSSGLYVSDCPANGCLGFALKLPSNWTAKSYFEKGASLATYYPSNAHWNRPMEHADSDKCPLPDGNTHHNPKYFGE